MTPLRAQFDRVQIVALVAGVIGLALAAVGAFLHPDPRQFFFSYLFAFVFWMGLPLGSLCVLMIHYLAGGSWGYTIRRFLEASISTLPLMAVLFVPFFFGLKHLYPWARPEIVAHDDALQKIHGYLNVPAYGARMAVCFGLWIAAAFLLNRWSAQQDSTSDPALTRRIRTFCGPALLGFVLTVSLATVDWIMVLERNWYSTVFPALLIIGQILLTFAFCAAMLAWVVGPAPFDRKANPISGVVRVEHFHSLGNFLLAFVMMWAYLSVSQLIIIWSGNEPREISWYLHRTAGAWKYIGIFLALFNFGLPFCLLLSRENKKNVRFLTVLALGICGVHAVERYWQIMPSLHRDGLSVSWLDAAALVGIGGVWFAVFLARLKTHLTLPQNDPRMEPALVHGH